ncbi:unnamed protein product [Ascophyllum nodosum]
MSSPEERAPEVVASHFCRQAAVKARKKQEPWAKAREGPVMSRKDRRAKNKALRKIKVKTLAPAVGDLESTHASSLGRCVSHMEDHVEEACRVPGPYGGTPERKRYPRPDKFGWK